ncbi:DUF6263 family protein [Planctomicrobium piriforme]|uniref:Uncharacterized protein n=1 Tax=Planctomicrobium piriforme TaxID=1576369 RepID=A0A1I3F0U1_9PLAN|nr:DUF6263 family protein [Planctomicrobium piriforme]SFI04812.1 hypothetical protein SAMN05421753_10527 [Planctomicrobium piriforme]
MTLRSCLVLGSLLACGWTAVGRADDAQPVTLRYHFQPGQIVRYDVTMNDDYRIQIGAAVDSPYSHNHSSKHYEVKSVAPDGSAVLVLTIDAIQLEIFQNGGKIKYDSRNKETAKNEPVFLALEDLVGKPHLQLIISPRGAVSNYQPLVAKDQVPSDPATAAFDVLVALPEQPVKVGETWKEAFEAAVNLTGSEVKKQVKMQRHYTLTSHENGLATIEIKTKILTLLEDADEEMQLLRRTPCGTVVIDTQRGLLVSKTLTQNNEVTGFQNGASVITFKQLQEEKLLTEQAGVEAAPAR